MSDVMSELKAIAKAVNGLRDIKENCKTVNSYVDGERNDVQIFNGLKESGLAIRSPREGDKYPFLYFLVVDGVRFIELSED